MNRGDRRVWKFPLTLTDVQTIEMPLGAHVLTVQVQDNMIYLWALCTIDDTPIDTRTFVIHGTGHPVFEGDLSYIGTVQTLHGQFVWHIFEAMGGSRE